MSVPPNNLNQLVAWARTFSKHVLGRVGSLEKGVKLMKEKKEKQKEQKK